jgi:DNA modification methylase
MSLPAPYWQSKDGRHVIYCADCLAILPHLTGVDCVVTDPPYGCGVAKQTNDATGVVEILSTWKRKAVFGYPEILCEWCATWGKPDEWVTWWATNGMIKGFATTGLWKESEAIVCFGSNTFHKLRRPRTAFGQWVNDEWSDVEKKGENTRLKGEGKKDARLGDCWTDPSPHLGFTSNQRQHPNEKPVTVMARLVEGMSSEGETIGDPFMGSGTTGVACIRTGRRFIGVELEPKYCAIAVERMERELSQPCLPTLEPQQAKQVALL